MLWLGTLVCGSVLAATPWWQPLGPVTEGEYRGGHYPVSLTAEQKSVARATDFPEWETYEDEFVRFSYPKHPAIKLEVTSEGQATMTRSLNGANWDESFRKSYNLTVGGERYGWFRLEPAHGFWTGICFCGPISHRVYDVREGCLVQYSLLPGGAIKRAELLGDGLRLSALEWTHLSCSREIYEKMAESLILKLPTGDSPAKLREFTFREGGLGGKIAWLRPGQPRAEVTELLGEPQSRAGKRWKWLKKSSGALHEIEIEFMESGKLLRLARKETTPLPPEETLDWVNQRLEAKPGSEGASVSPAQLASALLAIAKQEDRSRYDEVFWLFAFADLVEKHQHRDPLLLEEMLRHSEGRSTELRLLKLHQYPDTRSWVIARLENLPKRSVEPPHGWILSSDAEALLEYAFESAPGEAHRAVATLLARREQHWASGVYKVKQHLGPAESRQLALQLLDFSVQEPYLAEGAFQLVLSNRFDDPAAVKAAIEKLPPDDPNSERGKARQTALDHLNRTP
jgi:hypothetical protein